MFVLPIVRYGLHCHGSISFPFPAFFALCGGQFFFLIYLALRAVYGFVCVSVYVYYIVV